MKERKEILRIRIPKRTYETLGTLANNVNMELPELGKFLLGAAARCHSSRFHRAIAAMIEEGEKGSRHPHN